MPNFPPRWRDRMRPAARGLLYASLALAPCGCVAFGYGDAADGPGSLPSTGRPPGSGRGRGVDGGGALPGPTAEGEDRLDAASPDGEASSDAGAGNAGDAGDASAPSGPVGPALIRLPYDGELKSACYAPDECNGDDLVCFGAIGTAPGLCVEDCEEDEDCSPIEGLPARCTNGQCLVNCAGPEEEGDGPCPKHMECRRQLTQDIPGVLTPVVVALSAPNFWCVYPVDAGTNDVPKHGKCEPDHGDGDCAGQRLCHDPDRGGGPGYCTNGCEADADCGAPPGVSSPPVCGDDGICELDCSGPGATCPAGMNCRDTRTRPLTETYRCLYIE